MRFIGKHCLSSWIGLALVFLAFLVVGATGVSHAQTEACCTTVDPACQDRLAADCTASAYLPQGPGTSCGQGIFCLSSETDVPGTCADGVDNDVDSLIDCADPDCVDDSACRAAAPALGAGWIGGAVILLSGIAAVGMRRRHS